MIRKDREGNEFIATRDHCGDGRLQKDCPFCRSEDGLMYCTLYQETILRDHVWLPKRLRVCHEEESKNINEVKQ